MCGTFPRTVGNERQEAARAWPVQSFATIVREKQVLAGEFDQLCRVEPRRHDGHEEILDRIYRIGRIKFSELPTNFNLISFALTT
jgi:hypothetical protein